MFKVKQITPLILFGSLSLFSTASNAAPPFVKGQVAVYASPHELFEHQVTKWLPNAGISLVSVETGKEWGQSQKLRQKGFRAGLNRIAKASLTPNDNGYSFQWHFPLVQSEQAWDITTGTGVKVAVLDTGLVVGGSDGINVCAGGYDIVNEDFDPTDGSDLSHGTHVAGTISQTTSFDNITASTGVAGLAPGACVIPVKVLDDTGSGSFADIADGIQYAITQGADVINMSLGVNARFGITNDAIMDPALDAAYNAGVTVIAASGNDGHRKNVSYPAIYPSVIAVGATDQRNELTRYSNRGTGLDVVAPGGNTSRDDDNDGNADGVLQETYYQGNFGYYFLQGTSMASPHVAAIAALLVSNGVTHPDDVFDALSGTATDLGNTGYDSKYGFGLVQAYDALTSNVAPPPGPPQVASSPSPFDGEQAVDVNTSLSWVAGEGAETHQVYFGVAGTLNLVSTQTETNYNLGSLDPSTVYDWQIIEVNSDGSTAGPVWTFTTTDSLQCTDADGDGYCVSEGDCNDNDSQIYPGHQDRRGKWGRNGVDNDCNGVIDG